MWVAGWVRVVVVMVVGTHVAQITVELLINRCIWNSEGNGYSLSMIPLFLPYHCKSFVTANFQQLI